MTRCPSCDRPLPNGAAFCPVCGVDLGFASSAHVEATEPICIEVAQGTAGDATEAIDADATQAIDATGQMAATHIMVPAASSWVCSSCGREAPIADAFCGHCGAARQEGPTAVSATPSAECGACRAALAADARFCPHCGARRGEPETAESREETVAMLGAATEVTRIAAPAFSPVPPPPPPPLLPEAQAGGHSRSHGGRTAVIAALALLVVAVAAFSVWWFAIRDTGPAARQAFVEQATPILTPVAAAQTGVNDVLAQIDPAAAASSSTPQTAVTDFQNWQPQMARAAAKLVDAIAAARSSLNALTVAEKARPLFDQVNAALAAHAKYGSVMAGIRGDPASLTAEQAQAILGMAQAASVAYAALAASAPALPHVPVTLDAHRVLSKDASAIAAELKAEETRRSYLQQVADLFDQTRAARETAEGVLDDFLNTQIPADNAAGQMQAAGADLQAALTQIDALAPPADQASQQIQNDYHAAIEHWTAAARLYTKWMNTVWGYYQAMGPYPQPGQPLEADLFLDPSFQAAQKEQKLADQTRVKLATAYDAEAAGLGLPADVDAPAM